MRCQVLVWSPRNILGLTILLVARHVILCNPRATPATSPVGPWRGLWPYLGGATVRSFPLLRIGCPFISQREAKLPQAERWRCCAPATPWAQCGCTQNRTAKLMPRQHPLDAGTAASRCGSIELLPEICVVAIHLNTQETEPISLPQTGHRRTATPSRDALKAVCYRGRSAAALRQDHARKVARCSSRCC